MEAHARGALQHISFTVSSHDTSLREKTNCLQIPLPSTLSSKNLSKLFLSEFESPAVTDAVSADTIVPFQTPVTLSERLTLTLKVTDTSNVTTTKATVSLPPTLCPMTSSGSGVFAPTDGGTHGLSVGGFSRCLVNTDVRGDGSVVAVGGSATNVQLASGTPTTTSGVMLFTAPRPAMDVVDAMLREACRLYSGAQIQVMPEADGRIKLFRNKQQTLTTVTFEWSSTAVCAELGISPTFHVPEGTARHGRYLSTRSTSVQLPPGAGTSALVAGSMTASTGLVLDAPLTNAATVTNSFGVTVSLTWPVGSYSVQTAAATFNTLADSALQAALASTTSLVHVTTSTTAQNHVQTSFASTDGGAFQVLFANDALANMFGFASTRLVSQGAPLTSTLALPSTRLHLSTVLNARSGHMEMHPHLQGAVLVDDLSNGLATPKVYRNGSWTNTRHVFQEGDVVEVRTHTDASPYLLSVTSVNATSSQLAVFNPSNVTLTGTCAVQPALSTAQSTLRWLFGGTAVSKTQRPGTRLLGLNPLLLLNQHLFSGGALPLRADAHPPSDLLVVLENAGSLGAKPSHYVRAHDGTNKPVLASVTIDRVTSHMETRMSEQGMLVKGKTGMIEIGLYDAATLQPSLLLSMDLRMTFTVVLA